jgi:hypothetical protein
MRFDWHDSRMLLGMAALLMVAGAVLFALPFVVQSMASDAKTSAQAALPLSEVATVSATPSAPSRTPTVVVASRLRAASRPPQVVDRDGRRRARHVSRSSRRKRLARRVRALGWVDITTTPPGRTSPRPSPTWRHACARSTLRLKLPLVVHDQEPREDQRIIRAAHAKKMYVVAWYLPEMTNLSKDTAIKAAISRTDDAEFDSFALDIESGRSRRSRAQQRLTTPRRRFALVGKSYHMGLSFPPVGLSKKGGYWGDSTRCAPRSDVFVPMSYYTYHAAAPRPPTKRWTTSASCAQAGCRTSHPPDWRNRPTVHGR